MYSHNGHINTPSGPVVDRRLFLGTTGIIVAVVTIGGVCNLVNCSGSRDSLDLYVSDRIPDSQVYELFTQLEACPVAVNLTRFSDGEMDESAWRTVATRSSSWLVFGASDSDARILSGLDCHDWTDEVLGNQDAFSFAFYSGSLQALPIEGNLGMLLCNMDLLRSAGAGAPASVSGLAQTCSLLGASGIEPLALEGIEVDSTSVSLALDAALASIAGSDGVTFELTDEQIAVCAASVLHCGRKEGGASAFTSRDEALRAFGSGDAAMLLISSCEFDQLSNVDFSCLAVSIPMIFAHEISSFRPTSSVVCSSGVPENARSTVLSFLLSKNDGELLTDTGSTAAVRNGSQGITVKGLPDSVYLGVGPAVLIGDASLNESSRRGYCEQICAMWDREEDDWSSYVDEVGVAL